MRKSILLLAFISGIAMISNAQSVKFVGTDSLHSKPQKVNIYIDKTWSMRGFFKVVENDDVNIVHSLFRNISKIVPVNSITYYDFDTKCSDTPIVKDLVTASDNFNGEYNVYSSAIESLVAKTKQGTVSVLFTDGVPSLTSQKDKKTNEALNSALSSEKNAITENIRVYLNKDKNNRIVVYRYYPLFNGEYFSSDKSFERQKWENKHRNVYAIVFARENELQFVDKMFIEASSLNKLDVKKLSPSLYEYINSVSSTVVKFENEQAKFSILINTTSEEKAKQISKSLLVKNISGKTIITNNEVKGNIIDMQLVVPEKEYSPNTEYVITADNDFISSQSETTFKNLETGANALRENDAFSQYSDTESFHSKTYKLSYLTKPIIDDQRDIHGFEITFQITQNPRKWISYFEPLFGAVPPRASLDEINTQLAPLFLFLLRWLTPIILVCIVFFFFLNHQAMRLTNPRVQWQVWWGGFVLTIIIVVSVTCYYMFSKYIDGMRPSTAYQLKHLIYNPIFSLLIYTLLSAFLSRKRWCTAISNPIPF